MLVWGSSRQYFKAIFDVSNVSEQTSLSTIWFDNIPSESWGLLMLEVDEGEKWLSVYGT
jgi:hypothetical protein